MCHFSFENTGITASAATTAPTENRNPVLCGEAINWQGEEVPEISLKEVSDLEVNSGYKIEIEYTTFANAPLARGM